MSRRKATPVVRVACLILGLFALSPSAALGNQASAHSVAFGAYVPKANEQPKRLDAFTHLVGRAPVVVSYYKQWDHVPFDPTELNAIWNRGAVPMITWEPFSYEGRKFPLRLIQRGRYDRYIRESARAAAAWGHPILVRFAQEMNGTWYPWARGVDGNNSYRIRAVWRRVVRIFREWGATNVQWVWTPNVNTGGDFPFRDLYPGDKWVDWIGFDGFNWALRGEWNSFTHIVGNTYEELAKLTSRPMIVAETGSSERGGDKAEWVTSALSREIPKLPRIRAVVWFDAEFGERGEGGESGLDAMVNSSAASLRAFRSAIASPRYGLTRAELLATPSDYARGPVTAPPAPDSGFGEPSFLYRITHKLHGRYLVIAIAVGALVILLVAGGAIFIARRIRRRRVAPPRVSP